MKPAEVQYAWRGWILGALFAALAYARWRSPQPLEAYGLIPIAAGACYRLYAGRFIQGHSNSRRLAAGIAVALGGPYRFGRHPLYLSNLAIIAGLILFGNSLPWPAAALVFGIACAHHALLARAEERYLAALLGEPYLGYLRVTSRWFGFPRKSAAALAPGNAATAAAGSGAAALAVSWARQGANLGKSAACVLILWILSIAHR
ncbi:MAG TPA: hypothetical protein VJ385_11705 [Fibrobacteria bacterium]|nr:hypothetical protein [Fibrobacteria bacterium]